MEELDYKIPLPQDTKNVFVGIDFGDRKDYSSIYIVDANTKLVLGAKLIDIRRSNLEEKQLLKRNVLEYYKNCKIVNEIDGRTR